MKNGSLTRALDNLIPRIQLESLLNKTCFYIDLRNGLFFVNKMLIAISSNKVHVLVFRVP